MVHKDDLHCGKERMEEAHREDMKDGYEDDRSSRWNPWCDGLPQHLLELILRHSTLQDRANFACVCRCWRAMEKQTPMSPLPWLMLRPNFGSEQKMSFFSLLDGQTHHINHPLPGFNKQDCIHLCRGWLLMEDVYWDMCFLLNPITKKRIYIPPFPADCFLAPDPTTPNHVILVTVEGKSVWVFQPSREIAHWRAIRIRKEWRRLLRPVLRGVNAIVYNSKLYFLDYQQNLTVLDIEEGEVSSMKLGSSSHEESGDDVIDVFLVESCGDILLVEVSPRFDPGENDEAAGRHLYQFDVFKVELDGKKRVEVGSLRNQILFLSQKSCFSISASAAGLKGNTIYYLPNHLIHEFDHWIEFDLDSGVCIARVLPNQQCGSLGTWTWLLPSL